MSTTSNPPGASAHAYIISGPDNGARERLAASMAAAAVCSSPSGGPCGKCVNCVKAAGGTHPDVITVDREPDKREIYVDRMRAVRADAAVLPNEAAKKVYIIKNADAMNAQAQNAILKTLEEPPSHAVFLLLAENPAALLPTVRSRCASVSVPPESNEPAVTDRARGFMKTMSSGDKTALCRLLFSLERLDKKDFSDFTDELRRLAAAGLRGSEDCGVPREALARLMRALSRADEFSGLNVGVGHITGLLMSELI